MRFSHALFLLLSLITVGCGAVRDQTPDPGPQPTDFAIVGQPALVNTDGSLVHDLSRVPSDAAIKITFNADVDPSTAIANSTSISSVFLSYGDTAGNTVYMPGVSVAVSGKQILIAPAGGFFGGATYSFTINTNLASTDKRALSTPAQLTFSTLGNPNGSQVFLSILYDFGTATTVDHFLLSYGTASQSYTQNDILLSIDQPKNSWVGQQEVTAIHRATFTSGVNYFFSVKACTASGQCSDNNPEAQGGMP